MKIKTDFVTNSSSTSFIFNCKIENIDKLNLEMDLMNLHVGDWFELGSSEAYEYIDQMKDEGHDIIKLKINIK